MADLRRFSREAELAVRGVTHLGDGLPVLDGVVVDRPGWIAATAEGMAVLTAPMTARIAEQLAARGRSGGSHRRVAAPGAVAAAPIGTVLGYLSGKVLGQFDPFVPDPANPEHPGRLLLVAPNIVKVERDLGADPQDFRMWVCLHESTHRLQFTAVPWLRRPLPGAGRRVRRRGRPRSGRVRRPDRGGDQEPRRRRHHLDRGHPDARPSARSSTSCWRMMTLLEGHADHVMDAVGPQVVPSVAQIRARFTAPAQTRRRPGRPDLPRRCSGWT